MLFSALNWDGCVAMM